MVQREQFSVKIPESMEESIESFAAETHRTKSNALVHLMWVGSEAGEDHVEPESDGPGVKTPISVSTEFVDVVGCVSNSDRHTTATMRSDAALRGFTPTLKSPGRAKTETTAMI